MKKLPDKFCVQGKKNGQDIIEFLKSNGISCGDYDGSGNPEYFYHIKGSVIEKYDTSADYPIIDLSTYSTEQTISYKYLIL